MAPYVLQPQRQRNNRSYGLEILYRWIIKRGLSDFLPWRPRVGYQWQTQGHCGRFRPSARSFVLLIREQGDQCWVTRGRVPNTTEEANIEPQAINPDSHHLEDFINPSGITYQHRDTVTSPLIPAPMTIFHILLTPNHGCRFMWEYKRHISSQSKQGKVHEWVAF